MGNHVLIPVKIVVMVVGIILIGAFSNWGVALGVFVFTFGSSLGVKL